MISHTSLLYTIYIARSHVVDVLWNSEPDLRHQFSRCFWSALWCSGKCVFVQEVLKSIIQKTPRKDPVFGHMVLAEVDLNKHSYFKNKSSRTFMVPGRRAKAAACELVVRVATVGCFHNAS